MKRMLALLMIAVLVLVCASCGKQDTAEAKKEETLSYTLYNQSGETIRNVKVTDNGGNASMTVSAMIENGKDASFSMRVTVDDTGCPNLQISYESDNGGRTFLLTQKTDAITVLPDTVEFTAPTPIL